MKVVCCVCEEESKKSVLYGSRMRHKIAAREKMDCTLKMQVPIELATELMQFAWSFERNRRTSQEQEEETKRQRGKRKDDDDKQSYTNA